MSDVGFGAQAVVHVTRSTSKEHEIKYLDDDEICWICHEGSHELNELQNFCQCKGLKCHKKCLSRWCLQSAGRVEERHCRFCKAVLPDWREAHAQFPKANPIMTVVHGGQTYQVHVEPGSDGKKAFDAKIREIFNLSPDDAVELTFGCKVPGLNEGEVTLSGWESFDAAVHCASISAGLRTASKPKRRASSDLASVSPLGAIRRLFTRS